MKDQNQRLYRFWFSVFHPFLGFSRTHSHSHCFSVRTSLRPEVVLATLVFNRDINPRKRVARRFFISHCARACVFDAGLFAI